MNWVKGDNERWDYLSEWDNSCTFMYDPIAKQITKETARKILKEDGTNRMQLDKNIFIHNTTANPVAMATKGTTVGQAIKENTQAMSFEIKQPRERINQLERENNQLRVHASLSTTVISKLDDFKRCVLEKEEDLYKARHNTYMNIQKIQDDYSAFCWSKLKARDALG